MPKRFARRINAVQALTGDVETALRTVCAPPTVVDPGIDLIVEGDGIPRGFIIEAGWACGYRLLNDGRRQILNFILPGDLVGASGVILLVADHSVATLTSCQIYPFSTSMLAEVEQRFPKVQRIFGWSARREMAMLQERVIDLGRRTARERLAHLILELLHRLRLVGLSDGSEFELPLTQAELGDALGLSIVHVNRTLRRLNDEGVIRYRPGTVTVLDIEALTEIADFESDYLHHARLGPGDAAGSLGASGRL